MKPMRNLRLKILTFNLSFVWRFSLTATELTAVLFKSKLYAEWYRKCLTRARLFSQTLAHGNSKIEMKQRKRTEKSENVK